MSQQATAVLVRANGLSVALSADPGALPRRVKVLHWGENPNAHGKRVFVGAKLVRALSAPTYPFRKVALDFEHNTLPGTAAYKESREPRLVAGFGGVEVVEGEGVFLSMQTWTPDGEKAAPHFCDVSAAAVPDKAGEVLAIPSVALCRNGAIEGMDFAEVALSVPLSALAALSMVINTKGDGMNWKEMIAKALGLDPATDDAELMKALDAALKKPDATALSAAVTEATKPLATQMLAFSTDLAAVRAELLKRDKAAILDAARRAGKVVALSAEAVDKLALADLEAHVKALPVTVPLSARTPEDVDEPGLHTGITDEQRAIALNCGLDPAKVWPAAE